MYFLGFSVSCPILGNTLRQLARATCKRYSVTDKKKADSVAREARKKDDLKVMNKLRNKLVQTKKTVLNILHNTPPQGKKKQNSRGSPGNRRPSPCYSTTMHRNLCLGGTAHLPGPVKPL